MTKVAIITDIHAGVRNDLPVFLDFQEKFFSQVFFPKIDELNIKTVINLGDSMDRRKYSNHNTIYRFKKMFFDELAKRNIYSPIIVGNHDSFHNNSIKVNTIDLVCNEFHYPNLKVINKPQIVIVDGFKILMVPWICPENADSCLQMIETSKTDICMGHFAINGFVMNIGQVATSGLDRSMFERYDMVFSGHFHHRSSDGTIYYLGSPTEQTWNDYNDTKGFHIFDLETRQLQFIPNPFQMFHKITYNDELYDYTNTSYTHYNGVYVKVVVEKRNSPEMYENFLQNLYDANPFNISIVQNYSDIIEISENYVPDQAQTTLQILHGFVDEATLPSEIDPSEIKGLFTEIYNDAINIES